MLQHVLMAKMGDTQMCSLDGNALRQNAGKHNVHLVQNAFSRLGQQLLDNTFAIAKKECRELITLATDAVELQCDRTAVADACTTVGTFEVVLESRISGGTADTGHGVR